MRVYAAVVVGCAFGLVYSQPAKADGPWYVSGSAGAYLRESQSGPATFTNGIVTGPGVQSEAFDSGAILNLAVGYRITSDFRVEGEIGYAGYQAKKVNPSSSALPRLDGSDFALTSGGDRHAYTGTVNGFYDLPVEGRIVPYLGGGIGFAHDDHSAAYFTNAAGTKFHYLSGSTDSGIFLLEGGVSIAVTDSFSIVPAYRYMRYFGDNNPYGDEAAHVFKVGLRYQF